MATRATACLSASHHEPTGRQSTVALIALRTDSCRGPPFIAPRLIAKLETVFSFALSARSPRWRSVCNAADAQQSAGNTGSRPDGQISTGPGDSQALAIEAGGATGNSPLGGAARDIVPFWKFEAESLAACATLPM